MVKNILIINIGIHIISWLLKIPFNDFLGLRVIFSDQFAPYQFFTYMWLHSHGSFWHLFGNMLGVFIFGPMLETVWGSKRFLAFYLICGLGAGILYGAADYAEKLPLKKAVESYVDNPNPEEFEYFVVRHVKGLGIQAAQFGDLIDDYYENENSPRYRNETIRIVEYLYQKVINEGYMVGASGALFGILFAFAYLFPNTELFLLFLPVPIKAKYLVFFYGMYELYAEFNRIPGDNVAHLAHLSGMLIAFILLRYWKNDTRRFY